MFFTFSPHKSNFPPINYISRKNPGCLTVLLINFLIVVFDSVCLLWSHFSSYCVCCVCRVYCVCCRGCVCCLCRVRFTVFAVVCHDYCVCRVCRVCCVCVCSGASARPACQILVAHGDDEVRALKSSKRLSTGLGFILCLYRD